MHGHLNSEESGPRATKKKKHGLFSRIKSFAKSHKMSKLHEDTVRLREKERGGGEGEGESADK